jgi:hypothetical protein
MGEFGPELQFARRAADATRSEKPFYIVKYHASGIGLDRGWNGQKWQGPEAGPNRKTFFAGESGDDPNQGVHYKGMIGMMRESLADLESSGIDYRVRAFVWMQGEQDPKNEISANRYAKNLRQLHERLLDDLNIAPCPVVFGQVLPYTPAKERFVYRDVVRREQANADHASGHADSYEWACMVSTDGIPVLDDTVHYSAEGLIELGDRFYEAYTDTR